MGANIVCQLRQNGYDVRILSRATSNLSGIQDCDYEKVTGDITSPEDLQKAVQGCDYVIHAAALTAQARANFDRFWQVNVEATENLIEISRASGVKRFVYVSTANCFTPGPLDKPGTEETGFMQWLIKSHYAYTKFAAQLTVINEYHNSNFPGIVVAPTFLLGPRDTKPSSGKMILYALGKRVIFYTKGGKSFADVEKVAQAVVNALEKGRPGQTYLLAGANTPYREFFKLVAEVEGKRKVFIRIPDFFLSVTAAFLTLLGKITGRKFAFDNMNKRLLTLDNYFSSQKAIDELDYKPTVLREAIKKSIDWFKLGQRTF